MQLHLTAMQKDYAAGNRLVATCQDSVRTRNRIATYTDKLARLKRRISQARRALTRASRPAIFPPAIRRDDGSTG